ncbi:MAG: hypothetical protein AAF624_13140 [Bacteroidota bacterium]
MRLLPLVLLLALVGCSLVEDEVPERDETAPIQTDAVRYTAVPGPNQGTYQPYTFDLVARFTNQTDATVYLERGFPDQPQPDYSVRLVSGDGQQTSAFNTILSGVSHDQQIAVAPGETRADTLRLRGPTSWDGRTGEAFGELEGVMELAYFVRACQSERPCATPNSGAVSNVFEVVLD